MKNQNPIIKLLEKLILETQNNAFRCQGFPIVGDYLKEICALPMFLDENDPEHKHQYMESLKETKYIPGYYLRILEIKNTKIKEKMYDITSWYRITWQSGMVVHNCMLAPRSSRMVQDRLLYQSDG